MILFMGLGSGVFRVESAISYVVCQLSFTGDDPVARRILADVYDENDPDFRHAAGAANRR